MEVKTLNLVQEEKQMSVLILLPLGNTVERFVML